MLLHHTIVGHQMGDQNLLSRAPPYFTREAVGSGCICSRKQLHSHGRLTSGW
jgi:hypothetical protein